MKIVLILLIAPLISFAGENKSVIQINTLPLRCAKFSDNYCMRQSPHSSCLKDPLTGQFGSCMPMDPADDNGDVTCQCI
jgi:hypothetical protein